MDFFKELGAFIAAYLLLAFIVVVWAALAVLFSPIQVPVTITAIFYAKARGWAKYIATGQDNAINGLLGGTNDTDVSGRVGFHAILGSRIALYMEGPINLLFWLAKGQENHCRASIEHDEHYNRHLGR